MNSQDIQNLFSGYNSVFLNFENPFLIEEFTTNLQFSNENTAVAYKLGNEESERLFHQRLENSSPGLLVLNKKPENVPKVPCLIVNDDEAIGLFLDKVYPQKEQTIKIFGITGTNGKSTCVSLCEQLVLQSGKTAASLGTVGLFVNGKETDLGITGTTPSFIDLRRVLHHLSKEVEFLFMEVSSHALVQGRLGKEKLCGAGWTSFSQDHLDYHKTMEEYFDAKAMILDYLMDSSSIIIPSSQSEIFEKLSQKTKRVKKAKTLDSYNLKSIPMFFKVHYNKDNLELSLELLSSEIDLEKIDLEKIKTPKGRFSIISAGKGYAVVDYAHTPDAIENLVSAAKKAFPKSKIYTLFGCGGDRDRTKRPLMRVAAEALSDGVIVTSDNPRSEKPEDIIKDILEGASETPLLVESDRETAILKSINYLEEGDVLLIAGKGHEEYQEINGEKIFFSDFAVVESSGKIND